MNKTGNKIVVNLFVGGEFQDVPVMRNGKPTKRTKRQYVSIYEDRELIGIEVQGHEIFIDENEKHYREGDTSYQAYNDKGERITVICNYGRTGKAPHEEAAYYDMKKNQIVCFATGYQGATGHGWGAYIKKINW